jgi:serine/threonine protein phosphatase PrpC
MDLFRRLFTQSPTKSEETAVQPTTERPKEPTKTPVPPVPPVTAETTPLGPPPLNDLPSMPIADGATRPLPPETAIASSNEHVTFGQTTDVGMVRNNNQDSSFTFVSVSRNANQRPDFGLFIVADGMGGHHDGEKASAITTHVVAEYITTHIYLPILSGENDADRVPITEAMISAVQKANAEVITRVPDGGTTLTAVAVIGDLAYVVHVGDSRVYLVTKDGIEQMTRDHSLVQRLIELDQLTREEASSHPQKNVLYRALGQNESLEVDALTRRLPPNSRLMLCSDGLWNMVSETEIQEITMSHTNPQEACDKLVALANMYGGSDNITAFMLRVPSN